MGKKIIYFGVAILLFLMFFGSCGGGSTPYSSGDKYTLTADAPVCNSKKNVDKMINFVAQHNSEGQQSMFAKGEATIISKGTTVNIIKTGIVVEIEVGKQRYYAPKEAIK